MNHHKGWCNKNRGREEKLCEKKSESVKEKGRDTPK
jgi:hypothetical protein